MEENNKLIAEFMGWRKYESFVYLTPFYQDYLSVRNRICQTTLFSFKELKFHNDWNWLMLVVEKIEKMFETESSLPRFEINSHCATFSLGFQDSPCFMAGCYKGSPEDIGFETKKEAVYYVAVEFIKWYNNSNLNENQKIGQSTII